MAMPFPADENQEIAAQLREAAALLEAEGASSYRVTAYRAAAGSIARSARPVRELFDARGRAGLQELPGVGERISSTIAEILITGGMSQPARPRGSTQLELELV